MKKIFVLMLFVGLFFVINTNSHTDLNQEGDIQNGVLLLKNNSKPSKEIEENDTGFDYYSVTPKPVKL